MMNSDFIYGKDKTSKVVSVEKEDGRTVIYRELNGIVTCQSVDSFYWLLYSTHYDDRIRLNGDLHYNYARKFDTKEEYQNAITLARRSREDVFVLWNPKEQFLVKSGMTYFKNMHPKDVSILSFDIETTSLDPKTGDILLISNTFRVGERVERKLFSYEDYDNQKEMVDAWCKYVQSVNPSILTGHNVFMFDLPYLRSKGGKLKLGRDDSFAAFGKRPSKFRRDGSQTYDYNNVLIHGREIIDTFFLSIKYDFKRNYPSYGLKAIIEAEGLEKADRIKWDFDKHPPKEIKEAFEKGNHLIWDSFKQYCIDDSDDALKLFDLMIPAYFYLTQSIPKSFQQIINGATGSQVNSFLVRAYLADKHSIPKADETINYQGGLVYGNPGQYKHVAKVDVASLYPSIISQYKICNNRKDPKSYFLKMVQIFTDERLENKRLAKETGERKYKDLSEAQKILINSAYGFLNAPGLNFNSPLDAEKVCAYGRQITERGIAWCDSRGWKIVNVDTDSFSFTVGCKFHRSAFHFWIEELNDLFVDRIVWEDDGIYKDVIVVKMKNYVLKEAETDKVTIKGAALLASMKEPALKQFIKDVIYALLEDKDADIKPIYFSCVDRIAAIRGSEINDWCSKKTITKAILTSEETTQRRIREGIQRSGKIVQEGDKIYTYFKDDETVELIESFDGVYDKDRLYEKLFKTIKIFGTIMDIQQFPNFKLKRNKVDLEERCSAQNVIAM